MRAARITKLEGPDAIEVQEVDDPRPRKGQVVVDVEFAGVNFPDLLMSRGMYQIRPPTPFPPGGEIAGTVAELGEGVEGFAVGDRVMALSFFGGFVTKLAVDAKRLVRIPDEMDSKSASCFAFTYATSYHALVDRAHLAEGESLLVLGAAGGVGLAAVEIGAALGAKVIAAASTPQKLDLCEAYGATGRIDYSKEDLKKRAKSLGVGGVDVVYDPVGGDYSEPALRALKPFGRHLVIGFAAGTIPAIRLNLALLKECAIVGVAWGAWANRHAEKHNANMDALFELWREGKLKPVVTKTYALDEVPQALHDMDQRKVLGKVAIAM